MKTKSIGQKVRVAIPEASRDTWAADAFTTLQGQTGIIVGFNTHTHAGFKLKEPSYLVQFSPPLPPLWSQGSQVTGHWFDESEIEVCS